MNELDVLADLPLEADASAAVTGGALLVGNVQSPLTLGIGQIANLDLGNGPIIGGHANIGL
jgi:hypothetical protein